MSRSRAARPTRLGCIATAAPERKTDTGVRERKSRAEADWTTQEATASVGAIRDERRITLKDDPVLSCPTRRP